VRIDVGPFCLPPNADLELARTEALAAVAELPMRLRIDPSVVHEAEEDLVTFEALDNVSKMMRSSTRNLIGGLTNIAERVTGLDIDGDGSVAGTPGKGGKGDGGGKGKEGGGGGGGGKVPTAKVEVVNGGRGGGGNGKALVEASDVRVKIHDPPGDSEESLSDTPRAPPKTIKKLPDPKLMISSITPYGIYVTLRLWVDPQAGMNGGAAATVREAVLRRFREKRIGLVWEIDMIRAGGSWGGRGNARGDDAVLYGAMLAGAAGSDVEETMMAAAQQSQSSATLYE
jgi:hypothetical protein